MDNLPDAVRALALARPWLRRLLEAYAFLDKSLGLELAHCGRSPACAPGCTSCCVQPIPLTAPEAAGIRLALRQGLAPFPEKRAPGSHSWRCPLLREGRCSVYALRPFACRRFIVFSRPCGPGEDATLTRPDDVHRPSEKALLHALRLTLPPGRANGRADKAFFTRGTALLQHIPWGGEGE